MRSGMPASAFAVFLTIVGLVHCGISGKHPPNEVLPSGSSGEGGAPPASDDDGGGVADGGGGPTYDPGPCSFDPKKVYVLGEVGAHGVVYALDKPLVPCLLATHAA